MTHFEYVSVAVAVIYALAVGRLLSRLGFSVEKERRYLVHTAWIIVLLLICMLQWWQLWRARDVEWTALRFVWVLALPALLYIRASILVGGDRTDIASFKHHYYSNRIPFFSVGLASMMMVSLAPWVFGLTVWLNFDVAHISVAVLALISITGLISKSEPVHIAIVILNIGLAISSLVFLPAM